ncbi:hypothetical protein SAMN02799631_00761 [Methylobacterium sp. 174MFSha1.1]|uniref:hypothetical protein n=1 Tax=Methylobacterium sp. 174MFSha1.1 TaxID=1502749 RepID=UPI0008E245FD|nr:hypothetical protein [Methylobacterium sp. 174MFSha1.1]SFU46467.1 hypothetical protein SAMN02799631_00761 [Methylobacterium sp. 174MFSha1.1]
MIAVAVGVIIGLPIVLFGFMRLDERPGWLSWTILLAGLAITFGPATSAAITHYVEPVSGRYDGR